MQQLAPSITCLSAAEAERAVPELGALLHACVLDGASIGFVLPFSLEEAEDFWRRHVLPGLYEGTRLLWVALAEGRIAGSVQLGCATLPNQRHRADVNKLMVHPDGRRRGTARALMLALEDAALAQGRTLLTLDTRSGDKAEPLYASLGYETAGRIPGYCRDAATPRLDATTFMFKKLAPLLPAS